MANPEHLKILKQGVEVWNRWRDENPEILTDLESVELPGHDLSGFNLRGSYLKGADLEAANLGERTIVRSKRANLPGLGLRLQNTVLERADLERANLRKANLQGANLRRANLRHSDLDCADLAGAVLMGANIFGASLYYTEFWGADLRNANFSCASFGPTLLANSDMLSTSGLDSVHHIEPSSIDSGTLSKSRGSLPAVFLEGCGLSDWEIEAVKLYNPALSEAERIDIAGEIVRIQGESPIRANPLFISYSHADTIFAEALETHLDERHIRYWRDVHDMKAGRMESQIDRALRHNPTMLLILSERSVDSDWVEWEASKARELEKDLKRDVLCPITLDGAWKTCAWPGPLKRQIEKYNILDFSEWQDSEAFNRQFKKLIDGLGLFYPKASGE